MERGMMGNYHVPCGAGEKLEITSNVYLLRTVFFITVDLLKSKICRILFISLAYLGLFCYITAAKTQVCSLRNCHILGIIKLKNMVKLSNYSKPYLYWRLECS
jgi:uncharacterized membrane protein